jgi:hypothetical protein
MRPALAPDWMTLPLRFRFETTLLTILIALGAVAALVGVHARYSVEEHNKRAEIAIDYADALNLALAARKPLDSVLADLKESGVTTLALWEDPLDDMRLEGAMSVHADNPVQTKLTFSSSFPGEEDRAIAALRNKTSVSFRVVGDTIVAQAPYNQISSVGIGLEQSQVTTAVRDGFLISPRLFNYSGVSPSSIQWMLDQVKAQCLGRANVVIFNGPDVLGNRGEIDATAAALRGDGLLYGSLELGKQNGDDVLSRVGDDVTVRVHSIGGNEMPTMEEDTAVARYALAVRERNIRSCYVRLFQNGLLDQPDVMVANMAYIKDIVDALHDGGITIGAAHPYEKDPRPSRVVLLIMGIGAASGGLLLLRSFFPITGRSFWVALILSVAVAAVLATRESTVLGRQIDALAVAISFPTIALIAHRPKPTPTSAKTLFRAFEAAFRQYALMAATTIVGIVLEVGLLTDRLMLIKVYEFLGIRLAIICPFLLYMLYEGLGFNSLAADASWSERSRVAGEKWRAFTASPLLMGQVLFGAIALVLVGLVVLRSGNDPGVGVSSSELSFRAALNRVFYVRPRTKEIFFGYPILLLGLIQYYCGNRRWYIFFALAGAIALADLQNTFCHLHTPLLISAIRAMLGWILGLIVGVALALIVRKNAATPSTGEPGAHKLDGDSDAVAASAS